MILFAKTGKLEPVFQFFRFPVRTPAAKTGKVTSQNWNWKTGKLEKCEHENWNTPPFQFFELENWKTGETGKVTSQNWNWKTGEVWPRKLKHAPFPVFRTEKCKQCFRHSSRNTKATRLKITFHNCGLNAIKKIDPLTSAKRGLVLAFWQIGQLLHANVDTVELC